MRATLTEASGPVAMLASAERAELTALYRTLGLSLQYEKEAATGAERVRARLQLSCGGGGI